MVATVPGLDALAAAALLLRPSNTAGARFDQAFATKGTSTIDISG